ncbi:MAG TPA: 2-amino-4-hydroxy-6-hydroxymethyldihydropteridine diphosphokinase [Longimicrobiaceae bacterium]
MHQVLFGLGANLGRPREQLAAAIRSLSRTVEVDRISSVYRTEPVGFRAQPDFYNVVLQGRSALEPEELLAEITRVEAEIGRVRTFRNAPRTIDVDLLDRAGGSYQSATLTLPHPRMHERPFVLVPLAEIAPLWRHPVLDLTASELLALLPSAGRVEWMGPLPHVD